MHPGGGGISFPGPPSMSLHPLSILRYRSYAIPSHLSLLLHPSLSITHSLSLLLYPSFTIPSLSNHPCQSLIRCPSFYTHPFISLRLYPSFSIPQSYAPPSIFLIVCPSIHYPSFSIHPSAIPPSHLLYPWGGRPPGCPHHIHRRGAGMDYTMPVEFASAAIPVKLGFETRSGEGGIEY